MTESRPALRYVLYVPGNHQTQDQGQHLLLAEELESLGYQLVYVDIDWSDTTVTQWVNRLRGVARSYEPGTFALAGFSFGAMTALITGSILTAEGHDPACLFLVGLSGYFAEDVDLRMLEFSGPMSDLRRRQFEDFRHYPFAQVVIPPHIDVALISGSDEFDSVKMSVRRAREVIRHAYDGELPGIGHQIDVLMVAQSIADCVDELARTSWQTYYSHVGRRPVIEWREVFGVIEVRMAARRHQFIRITPHAWDKFVTGLAIGSINEVSVAEYFGWPEDDAAAG